jgi:hypothetical protein
LQSGASDCAIREQPGSSTNSGKGLVAKQFSSGKKVSSSGIYRVSHQRHRLPHEVTLMAGDVFPPCARCGDHVRFALIREVPDQLARLGGKRNLYSLPVLSDDDDMPKSA